jgi:hypothetical protein
MANLSQPSVLNLNLIIVTPNLENYYTSPYFESSLLSKFIPFPDGVNFNTILLPTQSLSTQSSILNSSSRKLHSNYVTQKSSSTSQNYYDLSFLNPQKYADKISNKIQSRYQNQTIDGVTIIDNEEIGQINIIQATRIIKSYDSQTTFNQFTESSSINPTPSLDTIPNKAIQEDSSNYLMPQLTLITLAFVGSFWALYKRSQQLQFTYQGELPWYNRPWWGNNGLWKLWLKNLGLSRTEVSESSLFLHQRAMMNAQIFAGSAKAIDQEKFSQKEFILFAKIKYCITQNIAEYQGLDQKIKLLQSALKAQKAYAIIHQIELNYQGYQHNQLYQFIHRELQNYQDAETFCLKLYDQMSECLPEVKTDQGREGLQSYVKVLIDLAQDQLALGLFKTFKTQQSSDYLTLKTITDIIYHLSETEVTDYKHLLVQVMAEYDVFEKLQPMLKLSKKQSSPDIYARLLQYVALEYRYQESFPKFEQLLEIMKKWYKHYQTIIAIRQEYPAQQYQQPQEFTQNIPGFDLYLKYKNSLTDQKTGYTYIHFDEFIEPIRESTNIEAA